MSALEMAGTAFLCAAAGATGLVCGLHLGTWLLGTMHINVKKTTTVIQKREP